jgi:thiol:disulfide interchange protein
MLALGGVLLLLRAAGASVGWAFQLQNPRVVGLLLLLVVAIAMNFAGLYELPTPNLIGPQRRDFWGSVGTGALAAFVATPCTGPFMAGALGAALILPPVAALCVFAGLGVGLALPFFAVAYNERLRALLPRPGAWLRTLRQLLSIPMFATALGLAWLLGRQSGVTAMTISLGAALVVGLALWWWGLRQTGGKTIWPASIPIALSAAMLMIAPIASGSGSGSASVAGSSAHVLDAIPFDEAQLSELRAQHRPVFVFVTADWCLTCKVNEMGAMSAADVARAFRQRGIVVMEADWTRNDPAITRFLAANGRAGIPLYLWYPASGLAAEPLPQLLTSGDLIKLAGDTG